MKNQTENVFKDRALDRKTIEKRIDFEPIKSQEAREQIMRTEWAINWYWSINSDSRAFPELEKSQFQFEKADCEVHSQVHVVYTQKGAYFKPEIIELG